MTVTRLWQAGAELQHVNELEELTPNLPNDSISGSMSVSNTKAKTGSYSFTGSGAARPRGKSFPSTTQVRAGAFLNHNGLGAVNGVAVFFCIHSSVNIWVQWNGNTANLELYVNTTLQASVAATTGGFSTVDTWRHCAITCKADASAGFVSFYIDGVQRLTYSGNTGTGVTAVNFHGNNMVIGNGWNSAFWDDFYIDDTVGEADAAPPSPRFPFLLVNGAGAHTNWSVQGVASNYQAIDDSAAPNDTTDYIWTTAAATKDSEAIADTVAGTTVPAGYSIDAVLWAAWAAKTNAGVASTLKLGGRSSGGTENIGSAQSLSTAFGPIFERQTTKPGGGVWTESDVDGAQIILESAGSFS